MLGLFKKKEKQDQEPETSTAYDGFEKTPAKPSTEASVKEISQYKNELLLRGKIGMSTGSSPANKPEKEEKKTQKPPEDSHIDKIDSEQAQVMKIKLNEKLDNQE